MPARSLCWVVCMTVSLSWTTPTKVPLGGILRNTSTEPAHRPRARAGVRRPPARAGRGTPPRDTPTTPNEARCGVCHWTSTRRSGRARRSRSTSPMSATFEASRARWNIDSPANRPPIARRTGLRRTRRRARSRPSAPTRGRGELAVRPADVGGDPPAGPPRVRAGGDHRVEGGVDADLEVARGLPHRARHPQPVQRQHPPLHRRPPAQHPAPRARPASGRDPRGTPTAGWQARGRRRWPAGRRRGAVRSAPARRGRGSPSARVRAPGAWAPLWPVPTRIAGVRRAGLRRKARPPDPPDPGDPTVSVRSAIAGKLIPDVHRVAPNANRGFVQQTRSSHRRGRPAAPRGGRRRRSTCKERGGRRPGDPRGHREPRPPRLPPRASSPTSAGSSPWPPPCPPTVRPGPAAVPHGRGHRAPARLRPGRPARAQRRAADHARRGRREEPDQEEEESPARRW